MDTPRLYRHLCRCQETLLSVTPVTDDHYLQQLTTCRLPADDRPREAMADANRLWSHLPSLPPKETEPEAAEHQ